MSPLVWDLAHIGNQEELWLLRARRQGPGNAMRPEIDGLYDAVRAPALPSAPSLPLLPPGEGPAVRGGGARPGDGRTGGEPPSAGTRLTEGGLRLSGWVAPARTAA